MCQSAPWFNLFHIVEDISSQSDPVVLPEVQAVVDQFKHLFAEPSALPPRRACDHRIPLIPGAQPVAVRPYRYSPALKTEMETQVSDMLQAGLIQPSFSAFSSPVLLVRKKDGTWRFCVDYRLLNALTVKRFNQIHLAPGEEHKTAFQTHWGHFEFTVMAFGLTGAPNTFQEAMNTTLHPLLRKCVLVFFDDILVYSKT